MIIGMLWACTKNIREIEFAKEYYIKKYKREPDTIEINPLFAEAIGIDVKNRSYDVLNIIRTKSVINGCILIGVEKDTDNSKYLIEGK